jgi:hypothetical protein
MVAVVVVVVLAAGSVAVQPLEDQQAQEQAGAVQPPLTLRLVEVLAHPSMRLRPVGPSCRRQCTSDCPPRRRCACTPWAACRCWRASVPSARRARGRCTYPRCRPCRRGRLCPRSSRRCCSIPLSRVARALPVRCMPDVLSLCPSSSFSPVASVRCCVVLCCVVLCCVVLCCVVLCCVVLCSVLWCFVLSCCVALGAV